MTDENSQTPDPSKPSLDSILLQQLNSFDDGLLTWLNGHWQATKERSPDATDVDRVTDPTYGRVLRAWVNAKQSVLELREITEAAATREAAADLEAGDCDER